MASMKARTAGMVARVSSGGTPASEDIDDMALKPNALIAPGLALRHPGILASASHSWR